MDKVRFKRFLEGILVETKDPSVQKQIENLLKELDAHTEKENVLSTSDQVPKSVLKKGLDIAARMIIRLSTYKAIEWLWEEIT